MVSAQRFRVQLTLSLCSLNLAHERIPQHTRANSTGQDSAVHLHLKGKSHSFEDNNENILAREDRWFERGVKESICQTGTTVLEQEVAQEITYHPLTMLNWIFSAGSLNTRLALATHKKAGQSNDPQVALMTLILRAHVCPYHVTL